MEIIISTKAKHAKSTARHTKRRRPVSVPTAPGRSERLRKAALAEIRARAGGDGATSDTPPNTGKPGRPSRPSSSKGARAAKAPAKPKRLSALDAAAKILTDLHSPMTAKQLIARMAEDGLWTSPGGKTPEATLYAAIIREIAAKGNASRFKKFARGQFIAAGLAAKHPA